MERLQYALIGRFSIAKMSVLFELTYRFNAISIKMLVEFLEEVKKLILKLKKKKKQRPRIVTTIWKNKNKVGGFSLPDFGYPVINTV